MVKPGKPRISPEAQAAGFLNHEEALYVNTTGLSLPHAAEVLKVYDEVLTGLTKGQTWPEDSQQMKAARRITARKAQEKAEQFKS